MSLRRQWLRLAARATAFRFSLAPSPIEAAEEPRAIEGRSADPSRVRLRIARGAVELCDPRPHDRILSRRYRAYESFLALAAHLAPALRATAELHLRDEHGREPSSPLPQLVFNRLRDAPAAFRVVPDVHFVKNRGYAAARWRVRERAPRWEERRPIAFWRGSSTGGSLGEHDRPEHNRRVALCLLARTHAELCDARIGRIVDCHPSRARELESLGLCDRFVAPEEQARARYLVSIDGWAAEWEGLVWKLASGSTVLAVESAWQLWYGARLEPWRHYLPVRADLGDLCERIAWCRSHDREARAIAERAAAFARETLTFAAAVRFVQQQLAGGPAP